MTARLPVATLAVLASFGMATAIADCGGAAPAPRADLVGTCSPGVVFVTPNAVSVGRTAHAQATVACSPGRYEVELTVVGQQSRAVTIGRLTTTSDGSLSGSLRIPSTTPPGFARVYVVANYSCLRGHVDCASGAAGTLTVLPGPARPGP